MPDIRAEAEAKVAAAHRYNPTDRCSAMTDQEREALAKGCREWEDSHTGVIPATREFAEFLGEWMWRAALAVREEPATTELLSICHGAVVRHGGTGAARYYVCSECGEACGLAAREEPLQPTRFEAYLAGIGGRPYENWLADWKAKAAREEPQPTTAQIETAGYLTAILGEPARDGVVSAKRGDQEFFVRPDGTLESGIMELSQVEVEGLPHRVGVKRRLRYDDMVGRVESMLLGNFGVNHPRIQWNSVARRVLDLAVELAAREDTERQDAQTTDLVVVEALDEIGLVRVEIDLAASPYLLAVSQARNLGELLIEAADRLSHA